ncbi:MAG: lipocalin/fatty-acid binding family protein [Paludibaculum sp.]
MRFLLMMALAVMAILPLNAADLAGQWKGSMETQMGTTDIVITIQAGPELTGTVKAGEYEAAIEKGKVDGEKISFQMTIGPGKVSYEGTVSGNEMKLNVIGTQGDKYVLVCKRQK